MAAVLSAKAKELLEACNSWWSRNRVLSRTSERSARYDFLSGQMADLTAEEKKAIWAELAPYSNRWSNYTGD